MIVCLEKIDERRFRLIDCDTGEPIKLTKKTRKRSAYQEFMSTCLKSKTGDIKDRFKICVKEWRNKK